MRNRLYRFAHSQLTSGPISDLVGATLGSSLRHRRFRIRCPDDTNPRVKVSLRVGLYEVTEIRFIERYLPTGIDCLELGASIGVTACHIRKRLDPDRSLISVEAMPDLARIARINLEHNHAGARWDLIQAAVWYGAETPRMRIGREHTHGKLETLDDATANTVIVPAVRLTDLCERIGHAPYSLVADIEGAEFDVLADDEAALQQCQVAIVEVHGSPDQHREFVHNMEECGLKVIDQKHSVWVFRR